jgi:asparagine synthase (glutamine-hydrolysing)
MCGIFGYFDFEGNSLESEKISSMGDAIRYRGPDGQGIYSEPGLALGNQRLAIIDIENGQQPFISEDGNVVVVQNGEIFNHVELAEELSGSEYECKTHSDTEVLLRLYQKHGIDFISKLNGMFAITIWDGVKKEMYLIRDRVGEKPLYYHESNSRITFASEIKSILTADINPDLDFEALDSFLTLNYVVPPLTLFSNVKHVMPGTYLKINKSGIDIVCWWSLDNVQIDDKSEEEWMENFNSILDDAVRIRMRADVPFGAFLSGGVDSSTVVGLMSKYAKDPVQTFTIGFHDEKYDESPFAQLASDRFGTKHTVEKVQANLLGLWGKATYHCDQPHGDVSFMPTFRVAELASRKVKMVLTGDGADELFAGYDKYKDFFDDESNITSTDEVFQKKYIENISLFSEEGRSLLYSKHFKGKIKLNKTTAILQNLFERSSHLDRVNQVLFIDTNLLLSGNNLVKPDRMGMAVSIENRAPFLDYRMIELAFSMPSYLKLKEGETKYIYKKAVSELIGSDLTYRRKQMFTVPVSEWLKYDLKEMVLDLLFSEKARNRELFNYSYVAALYADHCSDKENNTREIRALMALEIWFREFID